MPKEVMKKQRISLPNHVHKSSYFSLYVKCFDHADNYFKMLLVMYIDLSI